ncbi:hypothetical protein CXB51_001619 [Gossypium anomalum]|uniref:Uncharacterized protein n=1 Tax=Gossypium anomalum TaxID=47600 RepID=A0A8J5ZL87_9ROSI|nr:hypothetical protein CXB51_001619 [Gossypium anomalum]
MIIRNPPKRITSAYISNSIRFNLKSNQFFLLIIDLKFSGIDNQNKWIYQRFWISNTFQKAALPQGVVAIENGLDRPVFGLENRCGINLTGLREVSR